MNVFDPCPFCSKIGFRPIHERADDVDGMCVFAKFTDGREMATGETFRKIDMVYSQMGECPPHHWRRLSADEPGGWKCRNCGETV